MTASVPAQTALDWMDPVAALARFEAEPYTLLLYGGGAETRGRFSYLCAFPQFVVQTDTPEGAFDQLRQAFQPMSVTQSAFEGGFAGLMGYDLAQAVEDTPKSPAGLTDWPVLAMGWYEAVLVFDHHQKTVCALGAEPAARRLIETLNTDAGEPSEPTLSRGQLKQVWSDAAYLKAAQISRDYVRDGDIFQVNLSHPFRGHLPGPDGPYAMFTRLAEASPAAFSAYFRLDADRVVITNSPERFVQVFADGRVETRPIKGTRPRKSDPVADAAEAEALKASVKDRAENLMIVDLMRNDLARVCVPGSVKTPELFSVEGFANVHHLVSTVTGQLKPDQDVFDLLKAAFPPGSITGAPKVRAMEIIAELEGESRGPYCGALGFVGADGQADLNVMIRTAACVRDGDNWAVEVRSGGAITIDSDPQAELEETRAKAAALKAAIEH